MLLSVVYFSFVLCIFFFFKQKTAYEMRISDWSSDVCSSDLIAYVLPEDDFDRALCAHHRDFGGGPGIVQVAAQMLGRHHVIGAAIGLAGDDGYLRHRRLAIGEQQLCAMLYDAEIGRATCRERVCQYVYVWVVGLSLKK